MSPAGVWGQGLTRGQEDTRPRACQAVRVGVVAGAWARGGPRGPSHLLPPSPLPRRSTLSVSLEQAAILARSHGLLPKCIMQATDIMRKQVGRPASCRASWPRRPGLGAGVAIGGRGDQPHMGPFSPSGGDLGFPPLGPITCPFPSPPPSHTFAQPPRTPYRGRSWPHRSFFPGPQGGDSGQEPAGQGPDAPGCTTVSTPPSPPLWEDQDLGWHLTPGLTPGRRLGDHMGPHPSFTGVPPCEETNLPSPVPLRRTPSLGRCIKAPM